MQGFAGASRRTWCSLPRTCRGDRSSAGTRRPPGDGRACGGPRRGTGTDGAVGGSARRLGAADAVDGVRTELEPLLRDGFPAARTDPVAAVLDPREGSVDRLDTRRQDAGPSDGDRVRVGSDAFGQGEITLAEAVLALRPEEGTEGLPRGRGCRGAREDSGHRGSPGGMGARPAEAGRATIGWSTGGVSGTPAARGPGCVAARPFRAGRGREGSWPARATRHR